MLRAGRSRILRFSKLKGGLGIAALSLVAIGLPQASAQTNTYQQGSNSYTGVLDTHIISTTTAGVSTATTMNIDGGGGAFQDASWGIGLFRFDNLFGAGANQIPLGSLVTSATLTITTDSQGSSQSNDTFGIYRLNTGFTSGATWANTLGGDGLTLGVDSPETADDVRVGGPASTASVLQTTSFDVSSSLRHWLQSANPNTANLGWALSDTSSTDGWIIRTSNYGTATSRPLLSVTYVAGPRTITWNAANTSGTWDSNNGANNVWTDNTTLLATSFSDTTPADSVNFSQATVTPVNITVSGTVNPSIMTVSHGSGTYTFGGGSINGLVLNKTGAGTLVLNSPNTFQEMMLTGGTVELGAAQALGTTGSVTLGGGMTLRSLVSDTTSSTQRYTFTGTSTIDVASGNNYTITGLTAGTGTLIKTGTGTLEFHGTSDFTGSIDIQQGTVQLAQPPGTPSGDLDVAAIAVRNGAVFRVADSGNPDLPSTTMVTIDAGGLADWDISEVFGGIVLNGGTFDNTLNNPTPSILTGFQSATPSNLMNGSITGNSGLTTSAGHTINKTTPGTVTVTSTGGTGVAINHSGPFNIQQGVFSTDSDITGSGVLTIGSATDNATLQLRSFGMNYTKSFAVGNGGATLDVSEQFADITWSGVISGGSGSLTKSGPGKLTLTAANTMAGPVKVTGGVLSVATMPNGGAVGPIGSSGSGAANLTLDGGALQYTGNSVVSNRGFTLGAGHGTIEVSNPSAQLKFTGAVTGPGGLTKTGPGPLALVGTNSYQGPTNVQSGSLTLTSFAAAGGFTLADATSLTVLYPTPASSLSTPTMSLGGGGTTLTLELQSAGSPTSPLINVTGMNGLNTNSGSHTINILSASPLSAGTYKLIDYAGAAIGSGFNLGFIGGRANASLQYNAGATSVDLQVISTDTVKWRGNVSADWDVGVSAGVGGTNNWVLGSNAAATNFITGDFVTFDDTAVGNYNVNLTSAVNPSQVTVNNSLAKPYAFQGGGNITGLGSLVKNGNGTLTLETNNDYTGTTTVNGGTLQIGNNGFSGTTGTGTVVNNSAIVVNRADSFTLNAPVTGGGTLTKQGFNTLTLLESYAGTGNISVENGILEFNAASPMSVSGAISGSGSVSKMGASSTRLSGNNNLFTGGVNIHAGTLIAASSTALGPTIATVNFGGTLQVGDDTSGDITIANDITGGGVLAKQGPSKSTLTGNLSYSGETQVGGGTLTLAPTSDYTYSAATTVDAAGTLEFNSASNIRFNNPVTGTGNLVKNGAGTVSFNGGSLGFTGTLTVNSGTFILMDDRVTSGFAGDLGASSIVVNNGGTFQFGSTPVITGENPDLDAEAFVTVNTGGTTRWYIDEDFGGIHLKGGSVIISGADANGDTLGFSGTISDSIWESGSLESTMTTAGVIDREGGITKTTSGTVTINNVNVNNTGGVRIENGTLSSNGTFIATGAFTFGTNGVGATTGRLELTKTDAGVTTTMSKPMVLNDGGAIVNVVTAGKAYTLSGAMSGTGGFTKQGAGLLTLSGAKTYAGSTTVAEGTLVVNGTHTGGGNYSVANGATLAGTGNLMTSAITVDAGGTLNTGSVTTASMVGTMTAGSADIDGTWLVNFNVPVSGTPTIDRLTLSSTLDIMGAILDFNASTTALVGAGPYIFASYGSLVGTFTNVIDLPSGYTINYNYNNQNQIALVPSTVPGDFDGDGDVDGADFVAWQTNFPTTTGATLGQGDGDLDGDVDGADFAQWQNSFPSGGGGNVPVPEPMSWLTAAMSAVGVFVLRRRTSRK